ncbi:hypothetical protein BS47DRAFT_1369516 [Hydnum rufescens UP504]|uniref:Uncharacterized protein n=1 Tax=Hydnum rufescens UP504 TaxID=1448309 RepID=A0A9P6AD14_9AGAM|nr:hypothetical protein BS47DRAFT_1369516 [Hydnum rufescens UP504]
MTRAQTATRHGNPTNGNPTNGNAPSDATHDNVPNDATHDNVPNDATHGNAPNDATHGNTPNEDVTTLNKGPRNHTPAMAGVWSYIRSSLLTPTNTDTKPPVTPAYRRPNDGTWGDPSKPPSWPEPAQTPNHKPTERHAANETRKRPPTNENCREDIQTAVHMSWSTRPQYPTPAAAGVGYYKILARTRVNAQPQTHGTTHRERKPQGGPIQPAVRAGVQDPSTPHPLQQILTQNRALHPQPQTRRMTRRNETAPSRRPNGPGPDREL